MKNLIPALIKAKLNFLPVKKDKLVNMQLKSGRSVKYKYAELDSVLAAVEPALLTNGLTIVQTIKVDDSEKGMMRLVTTLWHESGESIAADYALPFGSEPKDLASFITYARRYSICAMLNIAAEDDDDGGNNSQSTPSTSKPQTSPERAFLMQESKDLFTLYGYDINSGVAFLERTFNVTNRNQLSDSQLRELIKKLHDENRQKVAE